jgi:hypothetical protein
MTKELGSEKGKVVLGFKHIPASVGECKKMNPNTLNSIPTLKGDFFQKKNILEQGLKEQTLFKLNIS